MSRILIVSPVANSPVTAGNQSRMDSMIRTLRAQGHDLGFCLVEVPYILTRYDDGDMGAYWGANYSYIKNKGSKKLKLIRKTQFLFRFILRKLNISPIKVLAKFLDYHNDSGVFTKSAITEYLDTVRKFKPDVLLFQYCILGGLAKYSSVSCLKICEAHDVFTERNARLRSQGINQSWLSLSVKQERLLLKSFDVVIAIQNQELLFFSELLCKNIGTEVVCLDILDKPVDSLKSIADSITVGYIASKNPQNAVGIQNFLQFVWPIVLGKYPDMKLVIAGGISTTIPLDYAPNVENLGYVECISDFYDKTDVVVNPNIGGSGLKIKTVEALQYGCCVVSTESGAEGLDFISSDVLLVVPDDSHDEFAIALTKVLEAKPLLESLSIKAKTQIQQRYDYNLELLENVIARKTDG